jgi:iron complex transport system ATP-binding protein
MADTSPSIEAAGGIRPPVAELTGVVAGYPGRVVLNGVDLRLGSGETVALLGPNGSGKSTLLRVLAGTLRARSGSVRLFGREVGEWSRPEIARRLAVLPQSTELPAGFRAGEVVAMGRIPHRRTWFGPGPDDDRAVRLALRDADAEELADRPVDELSGGERQRVLVAMALAQEPAVLLLDEPTLHLDLAHQLGLVRALGRLRRAREISVVAVLHDLNLASGWADRCLVLHDGRLQAATAPDGSFDLGTARAAFGTPIEEAVTSSGRRILVAPVVRD